MLLFISVSLNKDAMKQMVFEGKLVGLRNGVLVYLEDVDVRPNGIVKVRPKGSTQANS
jgi:hypothetical protein